MEGAPLDTEGMDNGRRTMESVVEGMLYCGNGELSDENLEGGWANFQERASSFLKKKHNEKLDQCAENSAAFH